MEKRIEEIKYEFDRLYAEMAFDDRFLQDAEAPTLVITKHLIDGLMQAVARWPLARRRLLEYRWPATWRDAFKERWFPDWAKRRWPMRYKKVAVDELAAIRRKDDEEVRYFLDRGWL